MTKLRVGGWILGTLLLTTGMVLGSMEGIQRKRYSLAEEDLKLVLREYAATAAAVWADDRCELRAARSSELPTTLFQAYETPCCARSQPMRAWRVVPVEDLFGEERRLYTFQVTVEPLRTGLTLRPHIQLSFGAGLHPSIPEPLVHRLRAHGLDVEVYYRPQ